jgi:hypothetical protein
VRVFCNGIEYVSVIFWMDLSNNAFWSVRDMYFGNVDRDAERMDEVVPGADGSVLTFTGQFTGTYGGGR